MEYFIDQEKYFYLIIMHIYAAISIGFMVIIAGGAMMVAYFQHILGMFRISRYKMNINNITKILIMNKIVYFG